MKTALLLTFLLASSVVMTTLGQIIRGRFGLNGGFEKAAVAELEKKDTEKRITADGPGWIKPLGSSCGKSKGQDGKEIHAPFSC